MTQTPPVYERFISIFSDNNSLQERRQSTICLWDSEKQQRFKRPKQSRACCTIDFGETVESIVDLSRPTDHTSRQPKTRTNSAFYAITDWWWATKTKTKKKKTCRETEPGLAASRNRKVLFQKTNPQDTALHAHTCDMKQTNMKGKKNKQMQTRSQWGNLFAMHSGLHRATVISDGSLVDVNFNN